MANAEKLITEHLDLWASVIKARSSSGRGSNKKREIYGIRRLRELILNLAVRGVLVEQDNEEEPAHETLARIAKTKELLTKTNKTRKTKTLPSIKEEELPFPIPPSWAYTRIDDLNNPLRPLTYGVLKPGPNTKGGIPLIKTENIQFRTIEDSFSNKISRELDQEYSRTRISGGEILLTLVGSIGRCAIASTNLKGSNLSRSVGMLVTMEETSSEFLLLALRALINDQYISNNCAGTAQKVLNISKVRSLVIGFPPLAEQHRIVAKVDELMALCDQLEQEQGNNLETHETLVSTFLNALTSAVADASQAAEAWQRIQANFDILFTTASSVDQLKQTILQLAVTGKLVPQDEKDETAESALKRISAERENLIKAKVLKKRKILSQLSQDDLPSILPNTWAWCPLDQLITDMDSGWSPACPPNKSPSNDTWGVLKTTAVQIMEFRENENKVLDDSKVPRPQYEVRPGDILITRAGPKNRVGISCLVEKTRPLLMISDKIIRFHLVEIGISERFISLCLNAGHTWNYLEGAKSGMAESQMNISQGKLRAAPIPLAPIREQHRIIAKVDELMALCDKIKASLSSAQETQLNIADSIVEQAIHSPA